MKDKKILLGAVTVAARAVFGSKQKTFMGNTQDCDVLRIPGCEIGHTDIPRVMVVGIATSLGVPREVLADLSALDLGETEQQITRNLAVLQGKYNEAAKFCMTATDGEENVKNGVKRFLLKHNLLVRHINHQLSGQVLPEFPYRFKREKHHD